MGFLSLVGGIVIALWILGFALKMGCAFIHILLIVGVIVLFYDIFFKSRTKVR
jgi:hypothetical protein